jgi:hypothetical protein
LDGAPYSESEEVWGMTSQLTTDRIATPRDSKGFYGEELPSHERAATGRCWTRSRPSQIPQTCFPPERLGEPAALGVTRIVHPWRARDAEEVARVTARRGAARDTHAPPA